MGHKSKITSVFLKPAQLWVPDDTQSPDRCKKSFTWLNYFCEVDVTFCGLFKVRPWRVAPT